MQRGNTKGPAKVILFASLFLMISLSAVILMDSSDSDAANGIYMTGQPEDQYIDDRSNGVFTVSVVARNNDPENISYTWQYSTANKGTVIWSQWEDVTAGVWDERHMLVVSPSDYDYENKDNRFRCVITYGAEKIESESAILYVGYTVHYVNNYTDLQRIGSDGWDLDHVYIQTATIVCNSALTPIGSSSTPFTGVYNGKGFAIKDITINTDSSHAGLFGYANGAKLINIHIVGGSVTSTAANSYAGGIVGYSTNTTIYNCANECNVKSTLYAGGIAGYADVLVEGCSNRGTVKIVSDGQAYAGGIVGYSRGVRNCFNSGDVSAVSNASASSSNNVYAGGISGRAQSYSYISSCYNSGNVYSESVSISTIAAGISPNGTISYCHNGGTVKARYSEMAYGLGSASFSYNTGQTTSLGAPGGSSILGYGVSKQGGTYTYYLTNTGKGTGFPVSSSDLRVPSNWSTTQWTIWIQGTNTTTGYPALRSLYELTDFKTHAADEIAGEGTIASFSVTPSIFCASYQWQVSTNGGSNWTNISGATSASYSIDAQSNMDENHYRCAVTTIYKNKTIFSEPAELNVVDELYTITTDVDMTNPGPGTGGFVYEGGTVDVIGGDSKTFDFTPRAWAGYVLYEVLVDGTNDETAVATGTYTFDNVSENHTLVAVFALELTIDVSSGPNGTIDPTGSVKVFYAETIEFIITADTNYVVSLVEVDGSDAGNAYSNGILTLSNVITDHTVYVEFAIQENTVTLEVSPAGSGSLEYNLDNAGWQSYTAPITVTANNTLVVRAGANAGYYFLTWDDGNKASERSVDTDRSGTYTATFYKKSTPTIQYHQITASSDPGAVVDPNGTINVRHGNSMTFTFYAVEGYSVSDVIIDGKSRPELISQGYYRFENVTSDHTIVIKNARDPVTLNISIEGKGSVEYSVNGGAFTPYSGPTEVEVDSDIVLRAYADKGYHFMEWSGDLVSKDAEVQIDGIIHSVYITATFEEDDSMLLWYILGLILILLALLLIVFFLYRRSYEVIKVSSGAEIIGKDKARRKKVYTFSVDGGSGTVMYRVGEDGQWKSILQNGDGNFEIPKDEVIDKITIEVR